MSIVFFVEHSFEQPLSNYPAEVSLMKFPDVAKSDNSVLLFIVHTVKGLEFENVFIAASGNKNILSSKALNTFANTVNYSL
jgi:superfamily I DNA/RNA helicase